MSNIDVYKFTFDQTCKELLEEALSVERGLANELRSRKISDNPNDQQCIRDFIMSLIQDFNYKKENFKTSQQGQFRIYKADYSITDPNGQKTNYSLTEQEKDDMRDIFNNAIKNRTGNWEERLEGLMGQAAGQEIIQKAIKGMESTKDLKVVPSALWRWDTELRLFFEYMTFENNREYSIGNFIHLEHKANLNYFHFGTKLISIDPNSLIMNDASLYNVLRNILVEDRMIGNYPIYYSVSSHQVLLSSDILSRPEGFVYIEPKQFTKDDIYDMAKKIYNEMDPVLRDELKEELFNIYTKQVWKNINKAQIKTTLSYQQ